MSMRGALEYMRALIENAGLSVEHAAEQASIIYRVNAVSLRIAYEERP